MAECVGSVRLRERLTREQETELVIAAEGGGEEARRRLVEAFLPAIAGLARRFPTGIGIERQELLQEGVAGLLFAAHRYDSGLNTPFWAYASFWVRKAMQELVAELTWPVALSDRAVRRLAQIRSAWTEHLQTHGVEPTNAELSEATGLSLVQLESLQAVERRPRGMDEQLQGGGEATATFGDTISDPDAEQAYAQVLDDIEIREAHDLADQLNGRERVVIRAHYGLGEPARTLSQIGGALGLTAEGARKIEVGALEKMRIQLTPPPV
jgi:RNA polymerase primary sigma factor